MIPEAFSEGNRLRTLGVSSDAPVRRVALGGRGVRRPWTANADRAD